MGKKWSELKEIQFDIFYVMKRGYMVIISDFFIFCVTLIGITLGIKYFKMAKLMLMPFGAKIIESI